MNTKEIIEYIKFYHPYLKDEEILKVYNVVKKYEDYFLPISVEYMLPYIFTLANNFNIKEITADIIEKWIDKNYFNQGIEKTIENIILKNVQERIKQTALYSIELYIKQEIDEFIESNDEFKDFEDIYKNVKFKLDNWINISLIPNIAERWTTIIDNKVEIPKRWSDEINYNQKDKIYKIIKRSDGSFILKKNIIL